MVLRRVRKVNLTFTLSLTKGERMIEYPEKAKKAAHSCNGFMCEACVDNGVNMTIAEIKRLNPPKEQWISVDDRLPEEGSHVQLYRPHIQFVGYYGGVNVGWIANAEGLPRIFPNPTHWKPLIEPPKQG